MLQFGLLPLILLLGSDDAAPASSPPATDVAQDDAAAADDAGPKWKGGLHFGVNYTEGNSDTLNVNLLGDLGLETDKGRTASSVFWNFGEADNESNTVRQRTVDNYGGFAQYDYFLSGPMFALANGSFRVDDIAMLDLRYILGLGLGYQLHSSDEFKWGLEGGFSYVDERFATAGSDTDFAAIRIGSKLDWLATKTTRFEQIGEVLPSIEDSEDFVMSWDNRLKVDMTDSWVLQLQYVYVYDNTPAAGQKRADQKLIFSLGWTFGS